MFSVSFFDRFGSSKWTPKCPKIEPQAPPENAQESACFWHDSFFDRIDAPSGLQNAPKSSPRGSQDALGARLPLEAGFGAILGSFLTPPEPRKSCSRLGAVLIFTKIAYGAREPKIDPTSSPKPPPEASKRLKLSTQDGASFLSKFQLKFERFWDPKMAPKITQNLLWRHLGASWRPPGPPGPLRGPSGGLPEAFGERFSSPEC